MMQGFFRPLVRVVRWALAGVLAIGLSACLWSEDPAFPVGTGEDLGPVFSYTAYQPKAYQTPRVRMVFTRQKGASYDMQFAETGLEEGAQEDGPTPMPLVQTAEFRRFGVRGANPVYLVQLVLKDEQSATEGFKLYLLDLGPDGSGRVGAMECAADRVQALARAQGLTLECKTDEYRTAERYQVTVLPPTAPQAVWAFLAEGLASGTVTWEDELDLQFFYDLGV